MACLRALLGDDLDTVSVVGYNFYRPNNAYLEAYLIKVIYIVVLDAILSFSFLNKLKPRANYLRIFLEYSLTVLYLIKGHFKLI